MGYTEDRRKRLDAMWARYLELSGRCNFAGESEDMRRQVLKLAIKAGQVPGWWFENALEAADLGMADEFEPSVEAEAVDAAPGSLAKLKAIAARAEAGQELFSPADGSSQHLERWEDLPGRRGR